MFFINANQELENDRKSGRTKRATLPNLKFYGNCLSPLFGENR